LRRKTLNTLALITVLGALPVSPALAQQDPTLTRDEVDRELVVRFSRAYGMAKGVLARHDDATDTATLDDPEQLDEGLRDEIYQIMDTNGLSADDWRGMLARMEEDQALRERVESLAVPFQYEQ
jgi:hypothetical protein